MLEIGKRGYRWWVVLAGALAVVGLTGLRGPAPARDATGAPEPLALEGLDSLTGLDAAGAELRACPECEGVVYAWSPRMPLSRAGIAAVREATEQLNVGLTLIGSDDLDAYARSGRAPVGSLADALLGAGMLAHAPALVVHRGGRPIGTAILGFKDPDSYRTALERRLEEPQGDAPADRSWSGSTSSVAPPFVDYVVIGVPGAYFRWVPGRQVIAYESRRTVYLLYLPEDGSRVGPGYIDFVPTPDGRYFVSPARNDGGLTFYDSDEVFREAALGAGDSVEPIFTDTRMRDQYPSVGILAEDGERTRYRVLTSWFEGIVYRDYDVFFDPASGESSVRPVGLPTVPCAGPSLSTPIMAQDGLEVAARDEATGTTKIFRIGEAGACTEVLDLGITTSKVAWHRTGRKLAFRIPRARSSADRTQERIFVYDRDSELLTGVAGSDRASALAFPDFVGDDALVFLIPGSSRRDASVFRVVEGLP